MNPISFTTRKTALGFVGVIRVAENTKTMGIVRYSHSCAVTRLTRADALNDARQSLPDYLMTPKVTL
jgi:hypothetical protein